MNLNEIKELIDKIDSSNIAYFEVKVDNSYIKMDKSLTRNLVEEKKASNIEETEKNAEEICRYLPLKKEKITGSCDILKRIISGDYDDNFIVLNPGDAVAEQMFRFNGR